MIRRYKFPYLVTVRFTDVHVFMKRCRLFRLLGAAILRSASKVLFLSPRYRDVQMRQLLSPEDYRSLLEKSQVIPNGTDPFWLANPPVKQRVKPGRTILFAGEFSRRKNLVALIHACELLHRDGFPVELLVVGEGKIPAYARRKGIRTPIHYLGQITKKEQLLSIYRKSHALAVPSLYETFGLIYAEAMSQGLPVVYTKYEGFDGHFLDGLVGYPVSPRDPADIAQKIKAVFSNYSQLSEQAQQGSGSFLWDGVINQLTETYQEVAAATLSRV